MTRLIFAGTPDFAVPSLRALLAAQYDVVAVYTQPDRPAKRGQQLHLSAIKQVALEHAIPVYQPTSLRHPEAQAQLQALNADVMIVVAYGLLLPEAVLNMPLHGCINVHGSLLPRWRGAAPIQRALEMGDAETGVTIMQMDKGLDTGPLYFKKSCLIQLTDTAATLFTSLATLGASALTESLPAILAGTLPAIPQDNALTCHAVKLSKSEAELDWTLPATVLALKVRAFNPWPVATMTHQAHIIKIWQATAVENPQPLAPPGAWLRLDERGLLISCGIGALFITQLQFANHSRQAVSAIYRSGLLATLFNEHASSHD